MAVLIQEVIIIVINVNVFSAYVDKFEFLSGQINIYICTNMNSYLYD